MRRATEVRLPTTPWTAAAKAAPRLFMRSSLRACTTSWSHKSLGHDTVDDIQSCITRYREYTISPVV